VHPNNRVAAVPVPFSVVVPFTAPKLAVITVEHDVDDTTVARPVELIGAQAGIELDHETVLEMLFML